MAMRLAPSLTRSLKIFTSVLTAIAIVFTVYRVIYRVAIRRFWWEDAYAVVALIGSVTCVVTSWSHFELAGQPSAISFWIYTLTYPTVIWSVRLSILLSILRITSPSRNFRRAMIFTAGLFVLIWFSLTIAFVGRYVSGHPWSTSLSQRGGEQTHSVAIFELIADILSDCTLISLPIYSLRSVKLPYRQRRLIIAAFSSSIFVTIISFFRTACQVFNVSPLINVAIDVQVACSLSVCNSLFIVTLVYRILHRKDAATDANANFPSSHSRSTPNDTPQLTTIDLDAFNSIAISSISTNGPTTTHPWDGTEKYCEDGVYDSLNLSVNNE